MKSGDVSVVICSYALARWPDLVQAVESAATQTSPVEDVIVVIDHCDRLNELARGRWGRGGQDAGVRVLENRGRPGLSDARNTGLAASGSDVVAFLDDDAWAEPRWIEHLTRAYDDPRVVACGGMVTPDLRGPRPSWWPHPFDWVIGCSYEGLARGDVRNPIGANMSVRRRDALAVGGFRADLGRRRDGPSGCEETDLCIRLRKSRPESRVVYEPSAIVHHAVPEERLTWRYFRSRCYAEGLSKAAVARGVGKADALSAERSYVSKVLPRATLRAIAGARRREKGAMRRAAAIVAGVAITTTGYGRGRLGGGDRPLA